MSRRPQEGFPKQLAEAEKKRDELTSRFGELSKNISELDQKIKSIMAEISRRLEDHSFGFNTEDLDEEDQNKIEVFKKQQEEQLKILTFQFQEKQEELKKIAKELGEITAYLEYQEGRDSRETILEAVSKAISILEKSDPKKTNEKIKWVIKSVKDSRKKVGGGSQFKVSASGHSQMEGIPVDGLIEELTLISEQTQERLKSESNNQELNQQFEEIQQIIKTLKDNSQGYFSMHPKMRGDKQHWRTELEAKLISLDWRATGSVDSDYQKAMEALNNRLELVLPPKDTRTKPIEDGEDNEEIPPETLPVEIEEENPPIENNPEISPIDVVGVPVDEPIIISNPKQEQEPPKGDIIDVVAVPVEPESGLPDEELLPTEEKTPNLLTDQTTPEIPKTKPIEKKKRRLGVVDISETIEQRARDASEDLLINKTDRARNKGWWRKIVAGIKSIPVVEEIRRANRFTSIKKEVIEKGNIFAGQENSERDSKLAKHYIVDRFITALEEDMKSSLIHHGEKSSETESNSETIMAIKEDIRKLLHDYATDPNFSSQDFINAKNRILNRLYQEHPEAFGEGGEFKDKLFADNFLEVADDLRILVSHEDGLNRLDEELNDLINTELVLGEARTGVRTETELGRVGRLLERFVGEKKARKWGMGRLLILPEVQTAAVAGALAFIETGAIATFRSLALRGLTFGGSAVVGAGLMAWREDRKLRAERTHHAREMARGGRISPEMLRRQELEETRYETVTALSLIRNIEVAMNQNLESSLDSLNNLAEQVAMAEVRIKFSDKNKIDLISYTDASLLEKERLDLDIAIARAKIRLRQMVQQLADRREIDLGEGTIEDYVGINLLYEKEGAIPDPDSSVRPTRDSVAGRLEQEKLQKDKKFKTQKRWKMLGRAAMGFGVGLGVGGVLQEVGSWIRNEQMDVYDQVGFVEAVFGKNQGEHITILGKLGEFLNETKDKFFGSSDFVLPQSHEMLLNENHVVLPEGIQILENSEGGNTFNIVRGNEIIASGIEFDDQGRITQAGLRALEADGISVNEVVNRFNGPAIPIETAEFIKQNQASFQEIHHLLWADNDTPKPIFDLNELKLDWGGVSGSGLDQDGNFVLSMARMEVDGSFHGDWSADAQQLMREGKLSFLIYASEETQGQAIKLPIGPDGNVIIDKDSWIAKNFFRVDERGNTTFLGRFGEVSQIVENKDGVDQIIPLATITGDGLDQVLAPTPVDSFKTIIDIPRNYDLPPVIPIVPRKSLEKVSSDRRGEGGYGYGKGGYGYGEGGYGDGYGLLDGSKYSERLAPEVQTNPNYDWSKSDFKLVNDYLKNQESEYLEELGEMIRGQEKIDPLVDVIITIPSGLEGKNLEKTIRNYAKLKNRHKFELVIFENHFGDSERDNTLEIINRMRREFPDLKIVHLYKKFEEKQPIGNIRKYLVDAVMLRKQKSNIRKSLSIVSNDADLEAISPDYADAIAEHFDAHPESDAILCKWDYPETTYTKFPLLHAAQRAWHYFDRVDSTKTIDGVIENPNLIGRNSAFRSGAYVAIGGYNPKAQLAEDLEIGWMINNARKGQRSRINYLNGAWLKSNPRRAVVKMLSGTPLVKQYGDFHVNEEVRNKDLSQLLENDIDIDWSRFKEEMQALYDMYRRDKKYQEKRLVSVFKYAMKYLGVDCEVVNHQVIIKDTSKLNTGLNQYRTQ